MWAPTRDKLQSEIHSCKANCVCFAYVGSWENSLSALNQVHIFKLHNRPANKSHSSNSRAVAEPRKYKLGSISVCGWIYDWTTNEKSFRLVSESESNFLRTTRRDTSFRERIRERIKKTGGRNYFLGVRIFAFVSSAERNGLRTTVGREEDIQWKGCVLCTLAHSSLASSICRWKELFAEQLFCCLKKYAPTRRKRKSDREGNAESSILRHRTLYVYILKDMCTWLVIDHRISQLSRICFSLDERRQM